jgi:hypothetical protein
VGILTKIIGYPSARAAKTEYRQNAGTRDRICLTAKDLRHKDSSVGSEARTMPAQNSH